MASVSDRFERLACSAIIVERDERQRRRLKPDESLRKSISMHGVLNPILITRERRLIAGERRLTESLALGLPDIPVRYTDELSPVEAQLLELEENIKRLDLDWQDMVRGIAKIHQLYLILDPDWTMGETADACALTIGTVSLYLKVSTEIDSNERVAAAGTVREAYYVLGRRDARAAGDALNELLEVTAEALEGPGTNAGAGEGDVPGSLATPVARPWHALQSPPPPAILPASDTILHADFHQWAAAYSGPRFNLVHFDPPYGVNFNAGPQARGSDEYTYDDGEDTYWALLDTFCTHVNKIMSLSSHLMLWTSADLWRVKETVDFFAKRVPSLEFAKFPLIWTKSDNAGVASNPSQGARHVYEVCLLATRGKRQIVKIKSDSWQSPSNRDLHPSTKPEPMLRHFMEMLVDDYTDMLDPTCGSGASIRAAESLGARRTLGIELDERYVGPARKALANARLLAKGSAALAGL